MAWTKNNGRRSVTRAVTTLTRSSHLAGALICWTAFLVTGTEAFAAEPDSPAKIMTDLREPPRNCTQVPFWFWNGPLDPEEFRRQLREMADKGVYAAMPHPRFGMDRRDYLEEPFWQAMAATLEEAKKLGMQVWLYDEYNWPSGGAGGRVTEGHPELYPRGLDYVKLTVTGPQHLSLSTPTNTEPRMEQFEKYLRAFVRRADKPEAPWTPWGEVATGGRQVVGELAAGTWEVVGFFQALGRNPSPLDDGSNAMTDYLSKRSLRRFLDLTHEQYYRRFGAYFGNVIPAVFCDESSTTAPAPFPWTEDFAREFARRRGRDLLAELPQLLAAEGQIGMATRMAYWQTVAELYGGRYLGNYAAWCHAHGLKLTGHVYEENLASYAHAPQLMQILRPMDLPGFDALGPQCPPSGAKTAISVVHLEAREESLCESLGLAGGWNCTLDMLRSGYNTLGWLGASRFVPHAFFQTVDNPRVECPPSFFFQNPYWKYYRAIADLTARLSCFNRLGTHVAPCAVYYPIESLWADSPGGKGQQVLPWQHRSEGNRHASQTIKAFNDLVNQLADARWDLDIVDDQLLGRADILQTNQETRLRIGPETFRVVIVPPVSAIGKVSLLKLDQFIAQGGQVICLERLPELVWPLDQAEPAATLKRWFPQGTPAPGPREKNIQQKGAPVLLASTGAQVVAWLERHLTPEVSLQGSLDPLRVSHRRLGNSDLFLLWNSSSQFVAGEAKLAAHSSAAIVDLDTGKAWSGQFGEHGLKVALRPGQSVVAVLGQALPQLPAWQVERPAGQAEDLSEHWEIQVVGEALDRDWRSTLGDTRIELPVFRKQQRDFRQLAGWEQPGFDDQSWSRVHALRGNALFTEASPILLRAVLPPGAKALVTPLPVTGEFALWLNGKLVEKQIGPAPCTPGELPLASQNKGVGDVLALETISHSSAAGIERPLVVRCGPAALDRIRPWKELGLEHYAGRVLYRKTVTLPAKPAHLWLDLGKVEHYVEVYLNGKLAGTLLWAPYEIDLAAHCQAGQNELVLVVANSIANRFAWDVWGTRGSATPEPSGILGPVRLLRQ